VIAFKNLLRRKVRTVFAVMQIAVAIAAFVSIVGVTQGLRGQFYRISQVFAFDLILQSRGVATPIISVVTPEDAAKVAALPGIAGVSLMGFHIARPEGMNQPISIIALDPGSECMRRYRIVEGRALAPGDEACLVIGKLMADELKLKVGDRLDTGDRKSFEVVGLFEPPIKDVPFLGGQALMTLDHLRKAYKRPANLLIAHVEVGRMADGPDEVRAALDRCEKAAPAIDEAMPRLQARTVEKFLDTFKQTELIDSFSKAILALCGLVSGIGVMNTMLMSVFDRTREIGLLRAVGWSRLRIVAMIELEGLLLALFGGVVGLPFGVLLIGLSKLVIKLGWLQVSFDPALYVQALVVSAVIGLIGALLPAANAASLQPTEALRYE
jgi:putative ABC transport system permease protein